jgi:hypothetical protein
LDLVTVGGGVDLEGDQEDQGPQDDDHGRHEPQRRAKRFPTPIR